MPPSSVAPASFFGECPAFMMNAMAASDRTASTVATTPGVRLPFASGLGSRVLAAALALYAVRISCNRYSFAAAIDSGKFNGKQRAALVVGGLLYR